MALHDEGKRDRDRKRHHASSTPNTQSLRRSFFSSLFAPINSLGLGTPSKSRSHSYQSGQHQHNHHHHNHHHHHHHHHHRHQSHDSDHRHDHHHHHNHRHGRAKEKVETEPSPECKQPKSSRHTKPQKPQRPEPRHSSSLRNLKAKKPSASSSSPSKSQSKSQPEPTSPSRIKLTLLPLQDTHSLSWILTVRSGLQAAKLKYLIRRMYKDSQVRLPSSLGILLYNSRGERVSGDTRLSASASSSSSSGRNRNGLEAGTGSGGRKGSAPTLTVWYRTYSPDDASWDSWKFNKFVSRELAKQLADLIDDGGTVGELRRKVAEHNGVEDENRVRVYAEDGMKIGCLQGNGWVVKELGRSWLCRRLAFDVRGEGRYVVFKGTGMKRKEGYVFHPSNGTYERGINGEWGVSDLKCYMERDCFLRACRSGKSGLVEGEEFRSGIRLRLEGGEDGADGEEVDDEMGVVWGATYEFELPIGDAEVFSAEEAWLLAENESCVVCGEERRVSDYPVKITEKCRHEVMICRECLKRWLQTSTESGDWRRLRCPHEVCEEVIGYDSVRRYAAAATFERYDRWMLNDALQEVKGFERCLSASCGYGHVHDPTCEEFRCRNPKCGARHCVKHQTAHEGETCKQYEQRQKKREEENEASEKVVNEMAKECPNCKRLVHKTQGCNHITCTCRHEWCYVCFAPFVTAAATGILLCHHNPGCTEAPQPFAHLFDREGNLIDPDAQQFRNVEIPDIPVDVEAAQIRRRPIVPFIRARRHIGLQGAVIGLATIPAPGQGLFSEAPFTPQPLSGESTTGNGGGQSRRGSVVADQPPAIDP
ncbi:hypothetical protein QBC42DRAFT_284738 [Cladorrhinum samala]|uniref:RBR-type E3 ubiquitin transferase n=1 Tax=Cladorrhinum samala TaxID=585594 RepID=A0AAV9HU17_9PEZI|nr:hypothetical protein QBC42DRAFT_284738 [Cladorrhinum samala]